MKAIKFNLLLDGKIIRSLDEVKDNFNIDDIYDLYNKRILHKWLRLQNEHAIADELDLVDMNDPKLAIEMILSLFGYEPSQMQTEVYAHIYDLTRRDEVEKSHDENKLYTMVIEDYHKNYFYLKKALHGFGLVKDKDDIGYSFRHEELEGAYLEGVEEIATFSSMIEKKLSSFNLINRKDIREKQDEFSQVRHSYLSGDALTSNRDYSYGAIKATVDEIGANYLELLRLDIFNFFNEFIHESPIVIMSCLMNPEIRKLMLENEIIATTLSKSYNHSTMIDNLEPYLQRHQGDTEGMWKYLGNTDKKYLVLNMTVGKSRVGEQSDLKKDFGHPEINGNYLILSGLTFKSASTGQSVYYLEV